MHQAVLFLLHSIIAKLTLMEYAKEMVTARGRPSGTATTTMVTAKMKNWRGPDAISEAGKPLFSIIHLYISNMSKSIFALGLHRDQLKQFSNEFEGQLGSG